MSQKSEHLELASKTHLGDTGPVRLSYVYTPRCVSRKR